MLALQPALKFNGGGHINHSLFWQNLCPPGEAAPPGGALAAAIAAEFGSVEALQARTGTSFPWSNGDGTALKTIVRSNPGATHLRKGVVVKHCHFNDFPAAK